jgi:hypothetical protein
VQLTGVDKAIANEKPSRLLGPSVAPVALFVLGSRGVNVDCSSCLLHQADNRTTASTATLRTMVAIPATSMLEIRLLDAMQLFAEAERRR